MLFVERWKFVFYPHSQAISFSCRYKLQFWAIKKNRDFLDVKRFPQMKSVRAPIVSFLEMIVLELNAKRAINRTTKRYTQLVNHNGRVGGKP